MRGTCGRAERSAAVRGATGAPTVTTDSGVEELEWAFVVPALAVLRDSIREVVAADLAMRREGLPAIDFWTFILGDKILEKGQATAVQSKRGYEQLMDSFVGTKVYAAPEILRHKPYDSSVDEYSTGVLVRARRPVVLVSISRGRGSFLCRV